MIQILTLIRFVFPFLLLSTFFCLYRKEYGFMKRFMWKMTMFQSARNLYAYLVVLMLIFINWCCHVTAPNLSVVVSTLLPLVLLNRKIAKSTFHLLHERKRLWFATLLLSMVCYTLPYMKCTCQVSDGVSTPSSPGLYILARSPGKVTLFRCVCHAYGA